MRSREEARESTLPLRRVLEGDAPESRREEDVTRHASPYVRSSTGRRLHSVVTEGERRREWNTPVGMKAVHVQGQHSTVVDSDKRVIGCDRHILGAERIDGHCLHLQGE